MACQDVIIATRIKVQHFFCNEQDLIILLFFSCIQKKNTQRYFNYTTVYERRVKTPSVVPCNNMVPPLLAVRKDATPLQENGPA